MRSDSQKPRKVTVFSWIFYDFANTIFSMNVVSMYFPLWITVNLAMEDLWVSVGNSVSVALVAVTMPVLGVVSDRFRSRMPFLVGFTTMCVVGTIAIGIVGAARVGALLCTTVAVVFYTAANYAYQGGLVFYNAMLPEVSTSENMGRISGYGVALGYIGSIVGMLLVMPFVTGGVSFLGIELPWLTHSTAVVGTVGADQPRYLDLSVDRDGYYRYFLVPASGEEQAGSSELTVTSRDTVIIREDGTTRRAVVVSWDGNGESSGPPSSAYYSLKRDEKAWGHVGSFLPTAILFFLFAIPTFLFVKDNKPLKAPRSTLAKSALGVSLPAVVYLPFLLFLPVVMIFVNPVTCRGLLGRNSTKHRGGDHVASGWHWVGVLFNRYHRFVCSRILRIVFGSQALVFSESLERIVESLTSTKESPGAVRFLVARFFYEDCIETIIIFMAVYAVKVIGFSSEVVVPFFLVATTAAAVGSFVCGIITDRLGPKRTLTLVLWGWVVCLVAVILCSSQNLFWAIACLVGVFLGSTWTSERPLLVKLVPNRRLGEFFGLYSLSGKAATITGPLIWGFVVYALGRFGDIVKYKVAVGALGLMMLIGLAILASIPGQSSRETIPQL